jgi:hypothetical protein
MRIKGVPPHLSGSVGDHLVRGMLRAADAAASADFVELAPLPYTTFDEIRLDAWFATLRAEVCSEVGMAPELAFPPRVVRRLRDAMLAEPAAPSALGKGLEGWRHASLTAAVERFVSDHPPPAALGT